MDKSGGKPKNKYSKFFPKAAVSFQNLPFSPGRDRLNQNKSFSGPITSPMIPPEARRKQRNSEMPEPTSPKVSCMGQIKPMKKQHSLPKYFKPISPSRPTQSESSTNRKKKKKNSVIGRFFGFRWKFPGEPMMDSSEDRQEKPPETAAPNLCQMKKFATSRETFANFDWTTAHIKDDDRKTGSSDDEEDGVVIIPFWKPIVTCSGVGVAREEV